MPYLRLDRATLAYADGAPVLSDLDLHLEPGWTAVVGANGAGKSTLLLALAGRLPLAQGTLHSTAAPSLYVAQRVDDPDPEVLALAADWSRSALRWRARLALGDDDVARWTTLSEGQRKRWQLAAALAARPGALLLDEPTNHLDAEARDLLIDALTPFAGVGVLVSHDRALLDALSARTVRVEAGRAALLALPFQAARAAWRQAEDAAEAARAEAKARHERALAAARQLKRAAAAAEHQRSAGVRMKGPKDHDARGVGARSRAEHAEASLSARARAAASRVAQVMAAAPAGPTKKRAVARAMRFEGQRGGAARLLALDDATVSAGPRTLLEGVTLALERGGRVHLAGPNGSGKSTLLRRLAAEARVPRAQLALVPQDLEAPEAAALAATTRGLPPDDRGRVLALAATLGLEPEGLLAGRPLTPGQAKKLALAAALGRSLSLLLLDEPTNHLDLPAIEALQDALTHAAPTLVLVTHDPTLAAACTDQTWRIEGAALRVT
jgi:ATPase subunit of ABC transporter with duplicated ATPase domains